MGDKMYRNPSYWDKVYSSEEEYIDEKTFTEGGDVELDDTVSDIRVDEKSREALTTYYQRINNYAHLLGKSQRIFLGNGISSMYFYKKGFYKYNDLMITQPPLKFKS